MKKTYIAPALRVENAELSNIICQSVSFGDGTTDTMHAREGYSWE